VILVLVVLYSPVIGVTDLLDAKTVLDYRSNLLSVLLTAFGAWIGAGAAYFFGRENVREAYEGIKALQQPSPLERLRSVLVREVPPRPILWSVKREDKIGVIMDRLKKEPALWFIPVLKGDGKIDTVIEEEAVWRYLEDRIVKEESDPNVKLSKIAESIKSAELGQLLSYIEANENLRMFKDQYISLELDQSVYSAYEQMDQKGIKLGIVSDAVGKAKFFITTGDIRKVMAQLKYGASPF